MIGRKEKIRVSRVMCVSTGSLCSNVTVTCAPLLLKVVSVSLTVKIKHDGTMG